VFLVFKTKRRSSLAGFWYGAAIAETFAQAGALVGQLQIRMSRKAAVAARGSRAGLISLRCQRRKAACTRAANVREVNWISWKYSRIGHVGTLLNTNVGDLDKLIFGECAGSFLTVAGVLLWE